MTDPPSRVSPPLGIVGRAIIWFLFGPLLRAVFTPSIWFGIAFVFALDAAWEYHRGDAVELAMALITSACFGIMALTSWASKRHIMRNGGFDALPKVQHLLSPEDPIP